MIKSKSNLQDSTEMANLITATNEPLSNETDLLNSPNGAAPSRPYDSVIVNKI